MRRHLALGVLVGAIFGGWDLIATRFEPLADDTPIALLKFYGPMFMIWGLAGFGAAWRGGRILDGVKAGATVAFATFVVFDVANLLRVNLFLEAISGRADWQNLVLRFHASGFASFRAFANYNYVTGAPFKILSASIIGAAMGLIGGLIGRVTRREEPLTTNHEPRTANH